ncbi:MAG: 50S ribosomal protein L18, partial [Nitrospiraceae bacterium]
MDKKESRLRRGRQTRIKIAEMKVNRLSVHRTNLHIYANLISPDAKILVSASTAEAA